MLFAEQVDSPTWPRKLCQNNGVGPQGGECVDARKYTNGVFITSPQNMTTEKIDKVKRTVQGSSVLAYFDFNHIPLAHSAECPFCHGHIMGDRTGRNCSTTYHCGPSRFLSGLQEAFPNRLAVHDITDGLPGVMVESYPGLATYVWSNASAFALANFLGDWLLRDGYDGIYLDGYLEPSRVNFEQCKTLQQGCASFMKAGRLYDVDGDGHPDSSAQVYGSYFAWAPAFVALMRARFGRSKIILANSGGSLSDSSLSGVTIEMEGCTGEHGGPHMCSNALDAQMIASTAADVEPLSILWMTHSEAMPADKQCAIVAQLQTQYPWVQAGTDFFDGSQVVC